MPLTDAVTFSTGPSAVNRTNCCSLAPPAAGVKASRAGSEARLRLGAGFTVKVTVTVRLSGPSIVTTPVYVPAARPSGTAYTLSTAGVTAVANEIRNHGVAVAMVTVRFAGVEVISTLCGAADVPPTLAVKASSVGPTRKTGAASTCREKVRDTVCPVWSVTVTAKL